MVDMQKGGSVWPHSIPDNECQLTHCKLGNGSTSPVCIAVPKEATCRNAAKTSTTMSLFERVNHYPSIELQDTTTPTPGSRYSIHLN